ncbi:MAG: site-specific DNA-methyltransferase [Ignavibacteriae bacterium]|nr:site-specific DNA-methyltransferase [Ignavibacteriota bacterium]
MPSIAQQIKQERNTLIKLDLSTRTIPTSVSEFWTSRQRQASSIHEVSYRACFKPHLPRYFIEQYTEPGDIVYDPYMGRGTTIIEAALLGRNVIGNDVNPLCTIFTAPRLNVPPLNEVEKRLSSIRLIQDSKSDIDLSMFFQAKTLSEIVSLKRYLARRSNAGEEDAIDKWIRMVATNRLTGHSSGFFSVYTLPPNQATSPGSQRKINKLRRQKPEYRNVKELILRKSRSLLRNLSPEQITSLNAAGKSAKLSSSSAHLTLHIADESVRLTVTSPPFLNIVQYSKDNWLRCWFNGIDDAEVAKNITMSHTVEEWSAEMLKVFLELFRITARGGYVAFEVGEVRKGNVKLDEYVVPVGLKAGFTCKAILINKQLFTKTANIWGIKNNKHGTNTNRIVLFQK